MNISSAKFVKGIVGTDELLENGIPQIVFIGRSNVGKSSLINSLTKQAGLAKTSSTPGRTQQINLFLINNKFYFVDLPGYGFVKISAAMRERMEELINWYLFRSPYSQKKIALIVDAEVGPTAADLEMLYGLEEKGKDFVVVANKIDKIKKSQFQKQIESIKNKVLGHKVIPYSSKTRVGVGDLLKEIF